MMKYILGILLAILAFLPKPPIQFIAPQFAQVQDSIDKVLAEQDLKCMTDNIYYESGAESYEGKLAVATVTMNRVRSVNYPKSVCGVVLQKNKSTCQFSWVCETRSKPNTRLYAAAHQVAIEVLEANKRLVSIGNAMFFHNETVNPVWASTMTPVRKIGGHTFYAPKRRSGDS